MWKVKQKPVSTKPRPGNPLKGQCVLCFPTVPSGLNAAVLKLIWPVHARFPSFHTTQYCHPHYLPVVLRSFLTMSGQAYGNFNYYYETFIHNCSYCSSALCQLLLCTNSSFHQNF